MRPLFSSAPSIFVAITILSFCYVLVNDAWAQTGAEDEHEHGHILSGDQGLEEEPEQTGLMGRLSRLDQDIARLTIEQLRITAEIREISDQITVEKEGLATLQTKAQKEQKALSKRLIFRRKLYSARFVELLLSADGPLTLKRREAYLKAIMKSEIQKLIEYRQQERQIKNKLARLKQMNEDLSLLQRKQNKDRRALLSSRIEEGQLLSSLIQSRAISDRKIELTRNALKSEPVPPELTGQLLPPARGKWIDRFRKYRGPNRARLFGHGIHIRSAEKAPVYAVFEGRIAYVGRLRRWGTVIIIAHSGAYHSIYAYMDKAYVKIGDQVQAQTLLGQGGKHHEDPTIYFELRRAGEPVNPGRWIAEVY